jgi:hypothetical protein
MEAWTLNQPTQQKNESLIFIGHDEKAGQADIALLV